MLIDHAYTELYSNLCYFLRFLGNLLFFFECQCGTLAETLSLYTTWIDYCQRHVFALESEMQFVNGTFVCSIR